jgi:hypothetical protein
MIYEPPLFTGEPEGMATIPKAEIIAAGGDLDATMAVFNRYGVPAGNKDYLVSLAVTVKPNGTYYTYSWMPKNCG